MKKIFIFLIVVYQNTLSPILNRFNSCRYNPSCSPYMLDAVQKYGLRGFLMGVRRIFDCHPFSKRPIYDPVTEREEK